MMPLAALAICIVGGKVVRLGKGWYELHQEVWSEKLAGVEVGHRIGRTKHALRATLTGPEAGPILEA